MTKTQEKNPKKDWARFIYPLLAMVSAIFVLKYTLFSDGTLVQRIDPLSLAPNEVEASEYKFGSEFYFLLPSLLVFVFSMWQTVRRWTRYYLSRKLYLAFLFLSLIPWVTTVIVLVGGFRVWFGFTHTHHVENTLNMQIKELETVSAQIREKIPFIYENGGDFEKLVAELVGETQSAAEDRFRPAKFMDVEVFYLGEKVPSETRALFPVYLSPERENALPKVIVENTEHYESIMPVWWRGDYYSNIINQNGKLFLRQVSADSGPDAGFVVSITLPIDSNLLENLRSQGVRVTLLGDLGPIRSGNDNGSWFWPLILRPLSTQWDLRIQNWRTGYFEHYGTMTFELDPSDFGNANQIGELGLFQENQKHFLWTALFGIAISLMIALIITFLGGIYLVGHITSSLNLIAAGHENMAQGNLDFRLPYLGKDQLGAMGRSFNSMVGNIQSLLQQVMEQQKYREELRIARDIQMSLLPDIDALDWAKRTAATCIPAREVGGDYYELLRTPEGNLGIFIADVSGKGTSAAFYMAELKGVLIALKHLWDDPEQLLMGMNEILQPALQSNVFISAAYLLLHPTEKRGELARAGHCPSFLVRADGNIEELMPPGMAIGIAKNHVFGRILKSTSFRVGAEDKIVLYTDGLDEMTFHNEMYGQERLKTVLSKNAALDAHKLKDKILEDVLEFLSSGEQNDDLTLVVSSLPDAQLLSPEQTALQKALKQGA